MLPSEYLEKGWTQHAPARNCAGNEVDPDNNEAISWCMSGAIRAAYATDEHSRFRLYRQLNQIIHSIISYEAYPELILSYNDNPNRTQDEVITVMKQAEYVLELNNAT